MQTRKPRILWVNEFSQMNTGFSVYGNEVLRRLYATGKYELFELASYVKTGAPGLHEVPWKVFPVIPDERDEQAFRAYHSDNIAQFGRLKLEEACLRCRPDIVVDIRDLWMSTFIDESPFRHLYKFYYMPTVDAVPQRDNWIHVMYNCDKVFAYTNWGLEVIKAQSHNQVNTICSTPPGADYDVFKPMDKTEVRNLFHMNPELNIIGFLSRNQDRKLIPDLIVAFREFITRCLNSKDEQERMIGKRTVLFLHTSYPDVGWDLPDLIKNSGVGDRILITYVCAACGHYTPQLMNDSVCHCTKCNNFSSSLTNTHIGVSREQLATLLNLCDCYMQFSNSEGFGMGAVEAAGCGIPVFATDYSAMADVVHNTFGYPIKVKTLVKESVTGCYRAQPDTFDVVDKWMKFFKKPREQRAADSVRVAQAAREAYNYDVTTQRWMDEFDKEELVDWSKTWDNPRPDIFNPLQNLPADLKDNCVDFVKWCAKNVLARPVREHQLLKLAKTISYGSYLEGRDSTSMFNGDSLLGSHMNSRQKFTVEDCVNAFVSMRNKINHYEQERVNLIGKFQEPARD